MISADIMNIIVAIIVGLKRALEYIKMHHFKGEHAKIFLGRGHSPQTPPSLGRGIPPPQTLPPSAPSAPPFECLRHSTPQTTFLHAGLRLRSRKFPIRECCIERTDSPSLCKSTKDCNHTYIVALCDVHC